MRKHLADNLMSWATIVLAFAAAAASMAGSLGSDGVMLAKWSIVAGAGGRALVMAARQIRGLTSDEQFDAAVTAYERKASEHVSKHASKDSAS